MYLRKNTLSCLVLFYMPTNAIFLAAQNRPKKQFRLPEVLREVSGLHYAAADSLWWLNDSGNSPTLYLTNGVGEIKEEIRLPIRNVDWEDLTGDDKGRLYIGDFGNNRSLRKDLKIYVYEPGSGTLDSIAFQYPDQSNYNGTSATQSFNVEGFFWHQDSLHLFSKSQLPKSNYLTKHYVLSQQGRNQMAELRDSIVLKKRAVTAAAIDPTTGRVALLSYYYKVVLGFWPISKASVYFFEDYPTGYFLRGKQSRKKASCLLALQYESLDFIDGKYLYIASEQTKFFKPRVKRLRIPKRHPLAR